MDSSSNASSPNPFHVDFIALLYAFSLRATHPAIAQPLLKEDPRNYSYLALAAYRLLRHLIPPHEQVVAAATAQPQQDQQAPPTTPPTAQLALTVAEQRVRDVFPAGLRDFAWDQCVRSRDAGIPLTLSADQYVQPTLSIDAAADEKDLSGWQRWLIASTDWQLLAGAAVEYFFAELFDLLSKRFLDNNRICQNIIPTLHEKVLDGDAELMALWLTIGMPATCPPGTEPLGRRARMQPVTNKFVQAEFDYSKLWLSTDSQPRAQCTSHVYIQVYGPAPNEDVISHTDDFQLTFDNVAVHEVTILSTSHKLAGSGEDSGGQYTIDGGFQQVSLTSCWMAITKTYSAHKVSYSAQYSSTSQTAPGLCYRASDRAQITMTFDPPLTIVNLAAADMEAKEQQV